MEMNLNTIDRESTINLGNAVSQLPTRRRHARLLCMILALGITCNSSSRIFSSVAFAAPVYTAPTIHTNMDNGLVPAIVANAEYSDGDAADATLPANRPSLLSIKLDLPSPINKERREDSSSNPSIQEDAGLAQSGGIFDPLLDFLYPLLNPHNHTSSDGLPVKLIDMRIDWSNGGDESVGTGPLLAQYTMPTWRNQVVTTMTDCIIQALTIVTGGLCTPTESFVTTMFPLLSPSAPMFRAHQAQGLTNPEMKEAAILLDPLDPIYVAEVLAGVTMPGSIPGLWSQPGNAGGGSFAACPECKCLISCVSLNGQNGGGVCNTVIESVGASTSPDAGTITIGMENFAVGTYEVDFKVITTYRLKGAGGRIFVSIAGAPPINVSASDDAVIAGRVETSVTTTYAVSGSGSASGFSWTPTISFGPGSGSKTVMVDGHIGIGAVRRISVPLATVAVICRNHKGCHNEMDSCVIRNNNVLRVRRLQIIRQCR